jgi:hypothetical protein
VRIAVLLLLESFVGTYVMFVAGRSNDSRNQKEGSGEDFGEEHGDVVCDGVAKVVDVSVCC